MRSDLSEKMFADALMELAKQHPLASVRVKDLCDYVGVERSTFYYHFRDKYDLIAWIFSGIFWDQEGTPIRIKDESILYDMLCQLQEQQEFFAEALKDTSQTTNNHLREYLLENYLEFEEEAIKQFGNAAVLDEETEYMLRHYAYGCLGNTTEWLTGRLMGTNQLTAGQLAHYQWLCMPPILKDSFLGGQ